MANEQIKSVARRVVEAINQKRLDWFDELIAVDAYDHALPADLPPTREATKEYFAEMLAAFPDLRYTVDFTIAEGSKVVQQLTAHGTMQGNFWGKNATGRKATWKESHISRFSGGKLVEHWAFIDQLNIMEQLGLPPDL
jgi:predicted ester cyclase